MRNASVAVYGDTVTLVVFLHNTLGHVARLVTVATTANADIAIHFIHKIGVALCPHIQHFGSRAHKQLALQALVYNIEEGNPAHFVHFANNARGQLFSATDSVYPNFVAFADVDRVVDQIVRKHLLSFIYDHKNHL